MIRTIPPLGWNTWNTFGANINEALILESADAMVESGLKDAGYEYIVIDDIWALRQRDENGRLVPDPEKFPHGMKYVADYIHEKGLKFGMYSCAGYLTCAGYPASYDYEWIDAKTFAQWGVDFLKYDYCYHPTTERGDILYKRMGLALANCGRDILFSACSWGADYTRHWIKETGATMWRSTGDINDSFGSIKALAQDQMVRQDLNGIGCFNDMDMLVVGMGGKGNVGTESGCTFEEYKLHFSLWALLNSPLMIGCDIRDMSDETKTILMNRDVLAINQDKGCRQPFFANYTPTIRQNPRPGDPFYTDYPVNAPIIVKFLDDGDVAIGFFNFNEHDTYMCMTVDSIGLPITTGKTIEAKDLWSGQVFHDYNGTFNHVLKPHSCRLFRAKIVDRA